MTLGKSFRKIWYSLRGRLVIFLAASIFSMAAIIAWSFGSAWLRAQNEAYRVFQITKGEISDQLETYLENCLNTARRAGYFAAVQQFLLSPEPDTVIFSRNMATGYVTDLYGNASGFGNIFFFSKRGRYLYASSRYVTDLQKAVMDHPFLATTPAPGFRLYKAANGSNVLLFIYPVFDVSITSRSNSIICVLVCNPDGITEGFPAIRNYQDGAAVLMFDGAVVSSSRPISGNEEGTLGLIPSGQTPHDGNRYFWVPLTNQNWEFVYMIPQSSITAKVFSLITIGVPLLCGIILIAVFLLILLMRSVNSGIAIIAENINALEYGQKPPHYGGPRLIEIERLSHSVSRMMERLDAAFFKEQQAQRKLLDAVTAQAQAEFRSYRAQINSHFLFNTLECMRAMAHSHKDDEMETLISSMALLFRYSLYAKAAVPVAQELEHVANFMNVINIRYGGQYTFRVIADHRAELRLIPSMTLQPLVENAVTHGFSARSGIAKNILVQAFCRNSDNSLIIRITDNGGSLSEAQAKALSIAALDIDNAGITGGNALHNIRWRMKLCFGDEFRLLVKVREGFYTAIELHIPDSPVLILPEHKLDSLCTA
jgi:two-component system sensor histidine kinase YesM